MREDVVSVFLGYGGPEGLRALMIKREHPNMNTPFDYATYDKVLPSDTTRVLRCLYTLERCVGGRNLHTKTRVEDFCENWHESATNMVLMAITLQETRLVNLGLVEVAINLVNFRDWLNMLERDNQHIFRHLIRHAIHPEGQPNFYLPREMLRQRLRVELNENNEPIPLVEAPNNIGPVEVVELNNSEEEVTEEEAVPEVMVQDLDEPELMIVEEIIVVD